MTLSFVLGMVGLGLSVGVVSNALGIGGGIIMVPAFIETIDGMDAHTAKGTSLLIITFVAAVNSWRLNRGHADKQWPAAIALAAGSIVGGYFGGWVTQFMPSQTVMIILAAFAVLIGVRTFFVEPRRVEADAVRRRSAVAAGIGALAGAISGMTGIGGGAILVPLALITCLATNERVVALSNLVMVATCASATMAHLFNEQTTDLPWTYGQVNVALAPLVFIGSQTAGPFGKWINDHLTLPRRKAVMGTLLIAIAVRLMWRALS